MAIYQVWENHFSAFGEQDIDKIMKDYDEKSVVYVWDHRDNSYCTRVYTGYNEIRDMFLNLFSILKNLDTLKVNLTEIVDERSVVFLEWECKGCGITKANDIFIFNKETNKFSHQSISVY